MFHDDMDDGASKVLTEQDSWPGGFERPPVEWWTRNEPRLKDKPCARCAGSPGTQPWLADGPEGGVMIICACCKEQLEHGAIWVEE